MKKANNRDQAKALSGHLATQMMLSKVSTHLLQADSENYHHQFNTVLRLLGTFCQADRCFVLQQGKDLQYYLLSQWHYQWEAHAWAPDVEHPVDMPLDMARSLSSQKLFFFNSDIPKTQKQGDGGGFHHPCSSSAVIVPIIKVRDTLGCLGMESVTPDKRWQDGDIKLLRRSAEYFASTMARIQAEQDKHKTEEKYRQLVDKAPLGIFTVNTSGYLSQFNPKMERIIVRLGFDLSRPINMLTRKAFIKSGLAKDLAACLEGKEIVPKMRSYTVSRGKTFYFRTHMTALRKADLKITGVQFIVEEITALYHAQQRLQQSERFLTDVMDSLKAGLVIIDPEDCRILDVNPYAAKLVGLDQDQIIGKICHEFICPQAEGECPLINLGQEMDNSERFLLTSEGSSIPILKSVSRIQHKGKELFLECFTDIRDLKRLLDEQQLDIKTSKGLLSAINGPFPRYTSLKKGLNLFSTAFYLPCQAEGGDHFFIRTMKTHQDKASFKTLITLKDQSGHQVGCILRSIITDLLHQAILCDAKFVDVGKAMGRLNEQLGQCGFIDPDSFCTAAALCLDHESLSLQYTLCGHPRFLLIRNGQAMDVPEVPDRRGMNMPLGFAPGRTFGCGEINLQASDKLIVFTDGLTEMGIGEEGREEAIATLTPLGILSRAQTEKGLDLSDPVEHIVEEMIAVASALSGLDIKGEEKKQNPDDITVIGLEIEDQGEITVEKWYPRDLEDLQDKIDQFLDLQLKHWRRRDFTNSMRLRICVEEAIVNAWKHGNKKDPDKGIEIHYRWGNDFHLTIEDQGVGFDVSRLPPPCDKSARTSESGRGIFMIRRSACEMHHNDTGTAIYMRLSPRSQCRPVPGGQASAVHNKLPSVWETLKNVVSY
ncbi:hypothetical protein JCM12294_18720 [Desulfocicer niacini]